MDTEFTGGSEPRASIELLWGRRPAPTRGPKPGLELEAIVEAGIAVADAEGLAGLSMRRIAQQLGVGTMSLYRYVKGKPELVTLMLERVSTAGEADRPPVVRGRWREGLAEFARGVWDLQHLHPWMLQVSDARPLLSPGALNGVEYVLEIMEGSGLSPLQTMQVIQTVYAYVLGASRLDIEAAQASARTGVSDEDFWAAQAPYLADFLAEGRHPRLAVAMDAGVWDSPDDGFDFGLQRLLDGIEKLIESSAQEG